MNDSKDNVVPFRPRHGRAAAQDAALEQRRREREDAVIARASEIREWVSSYRRRLPLEQRTQLATNLGRMLYSNDRLKRGDLTEILVAAGISRREDNTKRLPRYATRPGRDAPSPKLLAAKPIGYLAIVEELARRVGANEDKAVCDLFAEVLTDASAVNRNESHKSAIADFVPLYRLILAVGDGAIIAAPCTRYFDNLERDRWIPAIDAFSRDMGIAPFGPLPFELYPEEPPEVSGIWLLDRNEFATDPNDLEFFEDRLSLLPKVAIYREDHAWFYLDVPNDHRTFWSGDGSPPKVDLQEISVGLERFLWLVVAPSGPTHVPTPYLARFVRMRVSGECLVNGEPLAFETYSAPGHIIFNDFSKGEVELGFTPSESLHVNFSFRLQEARLESRFIENSIFNGSSPPFQDWPSTEGVMGMNLFKHVLCLDAACDSAYERPRLIPITPSSVAKDLGVPRSLACDDVEDISVFAVAPFRTSGSVVETMLRFANGKELQDELIQSVRSLLIQQEREGERLLAMRTTQLDAVLNGLSSPSDRDEERS